jgi:hypothetical protein
MVNVPVILMVSPVKTYARSAAGKTGIHGCKYNDKTRISRIGDTNFTNLRHELHEFSFDRVINLCNLNRFMYFAYSIKFV